MSFTAVETQPNCHGPSMRATQGITRQHCARKDHFFQIAWEQVRGSGLDGPHARAMTPN